MMAGQLARAVKKWDAVEPPPPPHTHTHIHTHAHTRAHSLTPPPPLSLSLYLYLSISLLHMQKNTKASFLDSSLRGRAQEVGSEEDTETSEEANTLQA